MPYIPNPDDATNPTDAIFAETAQAEFRALKGKVNNIATAGGNKSTFRQGILACAMTGDLAGFLTSGAGLAVTLLASASAVILTMAAGFNNAGAVDINSVIGADQANYWAGLPANNLSFLSIDNANNTIVTSGTFVLGSAVITAIPSTVGMTVGMNLAAAGFIQNNSVIKSVDTATQITMSNNALAAAVGSAFTAVGTLAPTSKLAAPQHSRTYDTSKQSVLQFGGAAGSSVFLDDFGNTWTRHGAAKVQTNAFKFGTGGLGGGGAANALDGATDYINSSNFTSFGSEGWALRCWVNPSSLPANGSPMDLIDAVNGSSQGARLFIFNNAGSIKFTYNLSSNGSGADIANIAQGTTTPIVGTWYLVELTYDVLAGVYRLYVNGIQETSTTSALKVCSFTALTIGARGDALAGTFLNGYIDKFECLPYCQHPAGTAYAVPVAAPSILAAGYAGDWFDLLNYIMWQVSAASVVAGVPPVFTQVNRVYVGEVGTGGAAVGSLVAYSPQGEYISSWITPLTGSTLNVNKTDNLGTKQKFAEVEMLNLTGEFGFGPGDITTPEASNGSSNSVVVWSFQKQRNNIGFTTGISAAFAIMSRLDAVLHVVTSASWAFRIRTKRTF